MENFMQKWQNTIAAILAVLVLLYGTYAYIYRPKIKEINSLINSLKLINTEIRTIPGGELLLKDIKGAKSMLQEELNSLYQKIPYESQIPYLIYNFISIVGKGLNIDYNLIQPGDLMQEQKYKKLPLKIEFEGDYANLNTYLAQLKSLPVTIRVDSMDLHRMGSNKKLSVNLVLSTFVMPGGVEKPSAKPTDTNYLSDPFFKVKKRVIREGLFEGVQGLKYSGYWMGKELKAIINDETYKVGNTIKGYTVVKIYRDRVMIRKNGKSYELPIGGNQ